jgi:hypothetical protein
LDTPLAALPSFSSNIRFAKCGLPRATYSGN